MCTVYEYQFNNTSLAAPAGKVVLVADQGGMVPSIWIETSSFGGATCMYHMIGTGHPVEDSYTHVGSCICGPFVWHIYRDEQS